jgi:hypothetical protein
VRIALTKVRCHTSSALDPVLAVADSEGGVNLIRWSTSEVFLSYNLEKSSNSLKHKATLFQKIACGSADTLCLSLDWDNRRVGGRYPAACLDTKPVGYLGIQLLRVFDCFAIRRFSFTSPATGWTHDCRGELARSRLRTLDIGLELLGHKCNFLWYLIPVRPLPPGFDDTIDRRR